jgi:molybdopterin molybdotransferase/putative molybdopterin biosynthesis protein
MGCDFDDRFDAVIPIENVDLSAGGITLSEDIQATAGRLVEPKGGTVYMGEPLALKGSRILSIDLANLTTAGVKDLPLLKKPKIAFIPTGNNLVPAGERPSRGQVIDCNSTMADVVLRGFGADVSLFPIARDARSELEPALNRALESSDMVLVGGGSSKGADDFCPRLIEQGSLFYNHYVKARPGRPIVTAIRGGKPVVNLPGPAFSTFFPLQWCIRGLIEHWFGLRGTPQPRISAQVKNEMTLDGCSMAYGLFFRVWTEEGRVVAEALDERVRGELFMKANAYAILPIGSPGFRSGDILELIPID